MDIMDKEVLWVERYRPRKVEDTILPAKYKEMFSAMVEQNKIPNLLLAGGPGVGKTTIAKAMLDEVDADYIVINGSMSGIDDMRVKITNFAATVSFGGGRKFVIIDEADYLTVPAQAAFRNLIEEFSQNCGFILTCNYKRRIMGAIADSRMKVIDFRVPKAERQKLEIAMFKRVKHILDLENIPFNQKVVAMVVHKTFPDFRKTLNEFQSYAITGQIDEGMFVDLNKESVEDLFVMLKDKKFSDMCQWVADNEDQINEDLFQHLLDQMKHKVVLKTQPNFIVIMGRYLYQHGMVANPGINMRAFLTEVMIECEYT